MGDEDRRADQLQQRGPAGLHVVVGGGHVGDRGPHARQQLVHHLGPLGPLIVQGGLGVGPGPLRRGEQPLDKLVGRKRGHRPQGVRMIGRAAVPGPIDHVDGIAKAQEHFRPARPSVGRGQIVGPLPASAVDQHQRPATTQLERDLVLHEHLPGGD